MNTQRRNRRDALVAVVTNDIDLERFRTQGWYRIPERALGRSLSVGAIRETNALALYQTSSITDGLPGAVELCANVRALSICTRCDLIPDEPDHPAAEETYHVLHVEDIHPLERPILSRRPRRVTFIRTTRERLFRAVDINDLFTGPPGDEKLWRELRELDAERKYLMKSDGMVMEVDFALFSGRGALGIVIDREGARGESSRLREGSGVDSEGEGAWGILRFSRNMVDADLAGCMQEIMESIRRMERGS